MITLNGDSIVETTETARSVKELRRRKQEIKLALENLQEQPDQILVDNVNKFFGINTLTVELEEIKSILKSVNLD